MKKSRFTALLVILVLTLLATWYATGLDADGEQDIAVVRDSGSRRLAPRPAAMSPPLPEQKSLLPTAPNSGKADAASAAFARNPLPQDAANNLFAARSWRPPTPVPVVAPAPAPRAPELPFRYLGRLEDGDKVVVFVLQGNRELVIRQGDQLTNYRVDEINRREMRITYLPLNETQRMLFGSND